MRSGIQRSLVLVGCVLILAATGWMLAHPRGPAVVQADRPPSAAPSPGASVPAPLTSGQRPIQDPLQPAARDTGADTIADVLEPQAGQLEDVLAQLRAVCPAARPPGGGDVPLGPATRCVEAAEAAMGTVELLRGTIASTAGAGMPDDVRRRWNGTLDEAVTTIREALKPLWTAVGRSLASGRESPGRLRAFAHLRDRIGGILSQTDHP